MDNKMTSNGDDDDLDMAEQPVLKELRKAGFDIPSLWEREGREVPDAAIDVLVKHLQVDHPFQMRWVMANMISGDYAKRYWPVFVKLFRKDPDTTGFKGKNAIGGLVGMYAEEETLETAIALAKDSRHGESRVGLLDALRRKRSPAVDTLLQQLKDDPSVGGIVTKWLKQRAAKRGAKTSRTRS